MTASIRTRIERGGFPWGPVLTDQSRDDARKDDKIICEAADPIHTTYSWTLVYTPPSPNETASSAGLSTSSGTTTDFIVDNEGAYMIRLVVDAGLPTEDTRFIRVRFRTRFGDLHPNAAGERRDSTAVIPYDITTEGWANTQNNNLQRLLAYVRRLSASGRVVYVDANRGRKTYDPTQVQNDWELLTNVAVDFPGADSADLATSGVQADPEGFGDFYSINSAIAYAMAAVGRGEPAVTTDEPYIVACQPGLYIEDVAFQENIHVVSTTWLANWDQAVMARDVIIRTQNAAGSGHTFSGSSDSSGVILHGVQLENTQPGFTAPVLDVTRGFAVCVNTRVAQLAGTGGPAIQAYNATNSAGFVGLGSHFMSMVPDDTVYTLVQNAPESGIILHDCRVNTAGSGVRLNESRNENSSTTLELTNIISTHASGYGVRSSAAELTFNRSEVTTVDTTLALVIHDSGLAKAGDIKVRLQYSAIHGDVTFNTDGVVGVRTLDAGSSQYDNLVFPGAVNPPPTYTALHRGTTTDYQAAYNNPFTGVSPVIPAAAQLANSVGPVGNTQDAIDAVTTILAGSSPTSGPYGTLDDAYDGFTTFSPPTPGSGAGRTIEADAEAVQIVDTNAPGPSPSVFDTDTNGRLQVENAVEIGPMNAWEISADPDPFSYGPSLQMGRNVWPADPSTTVPSFRPVPMALVQGNSQAFESHNYGLRLHTQSASAVGNGHVGWLQLKAGDAIQQPVAVASSLPGDVHVQAGSYWNTTPQGMTPIIPGDVWVAPGVDVNGAAPPPLAPPVPWSPPSPGAYGYFRIADPLTATGAVLTAQNVFPGAGGFGTADIALATPDGVVVATIDDTMNLAAVIAAFNTPTQGHGLLVAANDGGGKLQLTSTAVGPLSDVMYVGEDPAGASVSTFLGNLEVNSGAAYTPGSYPGYINIHCPADGWIVFGDDDGAGPPKLPMSYDANTGKLWVPGPIDPTSVIFDFAAPPTTGSDEGAIFVGDGTSGTVAGDLYFRPQNNGALVDISTGGGGGFVNPAPQKFVFRPGGSAGDNVYTDWNTLMAAVGAASGYKEIVMDDTAGAVTIPSGVWNLAGVALTDGDLLTSTTGTPTQVSVTLANGAVLSGVSVLRNLDITGPGAGGSPITFVAGLSFLILDNGTLTSGGVPVINVDGAGTTLVVYGRNASIMGSGGPVIHCTNSGSVAPSLQAISVLQNGTLSDDGTGTVISAVVTSSSFMSITPADHPAFNPAGFPSDFVYSDAALRMGYDNSGSGLTATNVQEAIDEVVAGGGATGDPDTVAYFGPGGALTDNTDFTYDETTGLLSVGLTDDGFKAAPVLVALRHEMATATASPGMGASVGTYLDNDNGDPEWAGGLTTYWESAVDGAEQTAFSVDLLDAAGTGPVPRPKLTVTHDGQTFMGASAPGSTARALVFFEDTTTVPATQQEMLTLWYNKSNEVAGDACRIMMRAPSTAASSEAAYIDATTVDPLGSNYTSALAISVSADAAMGEVARFEGIETDNRHQGYLGINEAAPKAPIHALVKDAQNSGSAEVAIFDHDTTSGTRDDTFATEVALAVDNLAAASLRAFRPTTTNEGFLDFLVWNSTAADLREAVRIDHEGRMGIGLIDSVAHPFQTQLDVIDHRSNQGNTVRSVARFLNTPTVAPSAGIGSAIEFHATAFMNLPPVLPITMNFGTLAVLASDVSDGNLTTDFQFNTVMSGSLTEAARLKSVTAGSGTLDQASFGINESSPGGVLHAALLDDQASSNYPAATVAVFDHQTTATPGPDFDTHVEFRVNNQQTTGIQANQRNTDNFSWMGFWAWITTTQNTERMRIDGQGVLTVGGPPKSGQMNLVYSANNTGSVFTFDEYTLTQNDSTGRINQGIRTDFRMQDSGGAEHSFGSIEVQAKNVGPLTYNGDIAFFVASGGANKEVLRLSSSQEAQFLVDDTNPALAVDVARFTHSINGGVGADGIGSALLFEAEQGDGNVGPMGRLTFTFAGNTGGGGLERRAHFALNLQNGGGNLIKLLVEEDGKAAFGQNVTPGLVEHLTIDGALTLGNTSVGDTIQTIRWNGSNQSIEYNRDATSDGWIDLANGQAVNNMHADAGRSGGTDDRIDNLVSPYDVGLNDTYIGVDVNTAAVTVRLPARYAEGARVGRTIIIKNEKRDTEPNGAGTNAITVGFNPAGGTGYIDDNAAGVAVTINNDNDALTLMCVAQSAASARWVITNSHN